MSETSFSLPWQPWPSYKEDAETFAQFLAQHYEADTVALHLKSLWQAHEATSDLAWISPFNMARLFVISTNNHRTVEQLHAVLRAWMNPLAHNWGYTEQEQRDIRVVMGIVAEYVLLGQAQTPALAKFGLINLATLGESRSVKMPTLGELRVAMTEQELKESGLVSGQQLIAEFGWQISPGDSPGVQLLRGPNCSGDIGPKENYFTLVENEDLNLSLFRQLPDGTFERAAL